MNSISSIGSIPIIPTLRGADALVAMLQASGVSNVFTLSGNHIMPIFDATVASGIRLIHTRHEAAAVHMADAFARLTGTVGIALVTGGPGHANAVSALYTAQMAESAVVLLSGHAPNQQIGKGAFQEMRQAEMAAPVCKASWTCLSADSVAQDVARAIRLASSGRPGPVHLSLPTDVLDGLVTQQPNTKASMGGDAEIAAEKLAADEFEKNVAGALITRLTNAKRPLILCGPQGLSLSLRAKLETLRQACGIPVIGMESPRGVADPSLGFFAGKLAQSDCILLLGKRLDFTLKFGDAPAISQHAIFLQVDAESIELDRSRRSLGERLELAVIADLPMALEQLSRASNWQHSAFASWRDEVKQAIERRPSEWAHAASDLKGRLHPVQALSPLQALLDSHPQSVLVSDGGEIGQWAQAVLRAPARVINGVAGSIGSALSFALAARVARSEAPIVAIMGDGTFGFHCSEIDTAVRYQLPFVAIVGNDSRWNAEYQIQVREYGAQRTVGCELLPTHYDRVAQAFGGHGESVSEPVQLVPAIHRAHASRLPAVINVFIEGLAAPTMK